MFTYVKGDSKSNYVQGDIISNPVGVKGLKGRPGATEDDKNLYYRLYSDIRPLYGIQIFPDSPLPEADDALRKEEGFWWLEFENAGDKNVNGISLEYIKLKDDKQPVVVFNEDVVGDYKALTVVKTYNYIDMAITDVKADLKQRLLGSRNEKVNEGYLYSKGDKTHFISTDVVGRQTLMIFNAQAVAGQDVVMYLDDGVLQLTAEEMKAMYIEIMSAINSYYDEYDVQVAAVVAVADDAVDAIEQAQTAAKWIYPSGAISRVRKKINNLN